MLSRSHLPICLLALTSFGPSGAAGAATAALPAADAPRLETLLASLEPLEAAWTRLRENLPAGGSSQAGLAPRLSPALGGALLRLEFVVASGDVSAHRAGAGLCAVVLDAARSADARPADLTLLELSLRQRVPALLERSALPEWDLPPAVGSGELSPAELETVLGPAAGRERVALTERYCDLRPTECQALGESHLAARMLRLLRESPAGGLPEGLALDLRADLAPGAPEAPR